MTFWLKRVTACRFQPGTVPVFLFGIAVLTYAWMIPWLGYYWDEWAFTWIYDQLGPEGLIRYFSTNRPVWGLMYQVDLAIFGTRQPIVWHMYALIWRWITSLAAWQLVRTVWTRREEAAVITGLLFLVYPGFGQQSLGLMYSHFFIIITIFLTSMILAVKALRAKRSGGSNFKAYYGVSILLGFINLLSMEYFFTLELVRWLLVWVVLGEETLAFRSRLTKTITFCLPFLGFMAAVAIWRTFFFGFHTYTPVFIDEPQSSLWDKLLATLPSIPHDIWVAGGQAWLYAFRLPHFEGLGARTSLVWGLMILLAVLLVIVYLSLYSARDEAKIRREWALSAGFIGLVALFLAGLPYWIARLPLTLVFPNDRFTLSYIFGSSLVLAALLVLIPPPRGLRIGLIALLVGGAVASHLLSAVEYRRDWNLQKSFFWQLSWRIPDLKPGTTVFSNELPIRYCSDNSLTAPLNWMYAPQRKSAVMNYLFYYPTVRLGAGLPQLEKNLPIEQDYLAASFYGNTSQMVGVYFAPPACLRVVDPELDADNWMLPTHLRSAAHLSTTEPILTDTGVVRLPPAGLFGAEPATSWCYYFQKADLARQQQDWQAVARYGDLAFQTGDYPNDPSERFPFIEGYAHTEQWQKALDLTRDTHAITVVLDPLLCRVWDRIERTSAPSNQREQTLSQVRKELDCKP